MVTFSNEKDVERWLADKSPEVASAIAARAALRVVPMLALATGRYRPQGSESKLEAVLPVLGAVAASWVGARYSVLGDDVHVAIGAAAERASVAAAAADYAAAHADSTRYAAALAASAAAARSASSAARATSSSHVQIAALAISAAALASASGARASARAVDSAAADIYVTTSEDVALIDGGTSARELARRPLWVEFEPRWVADCWRDLQGTLAVLDEDWFVWTQWYQARLIGGPAVESLEVARVLIAPGIWDQGAKAANAEINRLIEQHRDSESSSQPIAVPAQKPAAVEPIWQDGKLTVSKKPTKSDIGKKKTEAAFSALRADLRELADDVHAEGNIDKRPATFLARLAERIPNKLPQQDELFRLGHVEAIFGSYAKTVDQEWPDFLAARFHAVSLQFDRMLRQSPLWRDFKRNAEKGTLNAGQIGVSRSLANETAAALRREEATAFVDQDIPQALDSLADALKVENETLAPAELDAGNELLAADLVESVNNTLKLIAEVALTAAGDYVGGFWRGFKKAARKQGPIDGEKAFKWLRRLAIGGGAGAGSFVVLSELITRFPEAFGWLERILHILR